MMRTISCGLLVLAPAAVVGFAVQPLASALKKPHVEYRTVAPLMVQDVENDEEISDTESILRWVGVQATVDLSIVAGFAYHMQTQWGGFDFERALAEPEVSAEP